MMKYLRAIPDWGRWLIAFLLFLLAIGIFGVFAFAPTQTPRTVKVGLVLPYSMDASEQCGVHYEGMKQACEDFDVELLVRESKNAQEYRQAAHDLAKEGVGLIFLCGNPRPSTVDDAISENPKVTFATMTSGINAANVTTCLVRMYQGRYLAGALAAMQTKTDVIGYVAAMQNPEVTREINAFALGARRLNPKVRVVVAWTNAWKNEEKETENVRRLVKEAGADIVTYHQDDQVVHKAASSLGVDYIGYQVRQADIPEHSLGSVVCRWDIYYRAIIDHYLKGDLNKIKTRWIGIEDGAVWLSDVPDRIEYLTGYFVVRLRRELDHGRPVFKGPIRDTAGNLRIADGEVLRDTALTTRMDWFAEGVEFLGK